MAGMRELTDDEVFGPLITGRQPVAESRELTDEEVFGGAPQFTPVRAEVPPDRSGFAGFMEDLTNPDPTTHYSSIIPFARGASGNVRLAPPSFLQESVQAVQAPARVLKGEIPESEIPGEARNMALTVAGAGNASSLARAPVEAGVMGMNMIGPPAKAAGKAVAKTATAIAQPIVDRMDIEGAVGRTLAKRMMQQNPGMTFDEAIAATEKSMAEQGPDAVLADTGETMTRLARNMAQGPGETAQRAKEVLGGRQSGEKTAVIDSIKRNVSDRDFYDVEAEAKRGRAKSGPLFKKAYEENPNTITPRLQVILDQEPVVKKAMEKGLSIERSEASSAGEKFSPETYGVVTQFNEAGDPIITQMNATPLKLWHATKRGIDSLIQQYPKTPAGKVDASNPEVGRLIGLRKSIDEDLKSATGGEDGAYARGNKIASEGYKLEEALNKGRAFVRGDEEITQKVFSALSPKEKDAYRAGVAREMISMIRKNPTDLTPSQIMAAIKDEAGIAKKLEIVLPTKEQHTRFMKDLENRVKFRETNRGARSVSQTGSIAMEEAQLAGDALHNAGQIVTETATKGVGAGVTQAVRWGINQLQKLQMPQAARDRIGKLLLSQDQAGKDEALRLIRQAQSQGWRYTP